MICGSGKVAETRFNGGSQSYSHRGFLVYWDSLQSFHERFSMRSGEERQRISGQSPYEPIIGFSRAVRCGHFISVSGTGPVNPDGSSAGGDDPALQMASCLEIIREALERAGSRLEDIVRTRIYLTSAADWESVGRVHGKYFALCRPASTMVVVAALLRPEWKVEVEADAIISEKD